MKKLFRTMLCAALLTLAVSVPAFAAEPDGPMLISPPPTLTAQGDFGVLINDMYAAFPDAAPEIKNDRFFLPFVATFDQLGFKDMTWDAKTGTVTAAKGNATISVTIGDPKITLTQNGETQIFESDIAPFVEPAHWRTYIPSELISDLLGYNVGWDADDRVVIIDDVDAILAANQETYELMDKYLAYSQSFSEKNQKVTGAYDMDMSMNGTSEGQTMDFNFSADGVYEMLTAGSDAFQFDTDMNLSWAMAINGVDATELLASTGEMPAIPESIDFAMRGNMTDGALYFQSAALTQMMGQPEMTDAWFMLDMKGMFDQMSAQTGMDYAALMELSAGMTDMSFEDILAISLKGTPLTDVEATSVDALAVLNAMCADSAFTKSGNSYINSMVDEDGVKMSFTLYTIGSKVNGYAIEMAAADPSFGEMKMTASMEGSKMEMLMTMDMDMAEGEETTTFTLSMTMDGTYANTSAKPATEPPAGAVIIDLMQAMTPPQA